MKPMQQQDRRSKRYRSRPDGTAARRRPGAVRGGRQSRPDMRPGMRPGIDKPVDNSRGKPVDNNRGTARVATQATRPHRVQSRAESQQTSRGRRPARRQTTSHPLVQRQDNERLGTYELGVKAAFDQIVPVLKEISALQHEADFERQAQRLAQSKLGFELPAEILGDAWIDQLDMKKLFAWSVFATYQNFCDDFYTHDPFTGEDVAGFERLLQECGFHTMDISPCADGRLAHLIRYVVRLPYAAVRRKSYAGALFDIEDSIQKWVETELMRHRESKPNAADQPTRYLKMVAYHYSSVDPAHEGCAAHGSDTKKAAAAGLDRLQAFQKAIENSFCCGASIDLMLMGVDTDTDAIRIHVPNADGQTDLDKYVEADKLFEQTARLDASTAKKTIHQAVHQVSSDVRDGTARLIARLIENNFSQIAYVQDFHGAHYADIGHAERFIGAGVGFEDIQLRNLMYFAYLSTVEESTNDLDVGISIFTGLNINRGLPAPVVVRFDYHGHVPGARARAVGRCRQVTKALQTRYADLFNQGLLHIMQAVRDCQSDSSIEVLACSAKPEPAAGGHA